MSSQSNEERAPQSMAAQLASGLRPRASIPPRSIRSVPSSALVAQEALPTSNGVPIPPASHVEAVAEPVRTKTLPCLAAAPEVSPQATPDERPVDTRREGFVQSPSDEVGGGVASAAPPVLVERASHVAVPAPVPAPAHSGAPTATVLFTSSSSPAAVPRSESFSVRRQIVDPEALHPRNDAQETIAFGSSGGPVSLPSMKVEAAIAKMDLEGAASADRELLSAPGDTVFDLQASPHLASHEEILPPKSSEQAPKPATKRTREKKLAGRASDEPSIPPASDFGDEHHAFFSLSHPKHHPVHHVDDLDEVPVNAHAARKMSAEAHQRRAHLSRYVGGAVAAAVALCLVGAVRAAMVQRATAASLSAPAVFVHAAKPVEAPPAAVPPQAAPVPPPVAAVEPKPAVEANVAPAAPPSSAAPVDTSAPPPSEAPVFDPAAAKKEKRQCQSALDSGNAAKAITAGEQSVAHDPSDAESWLLLGAAYQMRGQAGEARRCFNACLKQGKRGPKSECAAMLR